MDSHCQTASTTPRATTTCTAVARFTLQRRHLIRNTQTDCNSLPTGMQHLDRHSAGEPAVLAAAPSWLASSECRRFSRRATQAPTVHARPVKMPRPGRASTVGAGRPILHRCGQHAIHRWGAACSGYLAATPAHAIKRGPGRERPAIHRCGQHAIHRWGEPARGTLRRRRPTSWSLRSGRRAP